MALNGRTNSRFAQSTPILTRSGEPTYGIAKKYNFQTKSNLSEDQIGSFTVTADFTKRPWKIAEEIYGNADLMWVLITFNRVMNPFGWPRLGQIIEYPKPSVVAAEL
jgi:hypothetical protein